MSVIEHPVVDDGLWSTIASHSDSVDREARFPAEAVAGLADAGLLALGVPAELGGPGGGLRGTTLRLVMWRPESVTYRPESVRSVRSGTPLASSSSSCSVIQVSQVSQVSRRSRR